MQANESYKEVLSKEGIKNTKHRAAILNILETSDAPLTVEDIFLKMKETNSSISLSTVYRTMETLALKKLILKTTILDDNRSRYAINRMDHTHNIICMGCSKMVTIDGCPFEELEQSLKSKTGFEVKGHKFEIYGYCENCNLHLKK